MIEACVCRLAGKLEAVCSNPVHAGFNHYLFESVAALINAAAGDATALAGLERRALAAFDATLARDVQARGSLLCILYLHQSLVSTLRMSIFRNAHTHGSSARGHLTRNC